MPFPPPPGDQSSIDAPVDGPVDDPVDDGAPRLRLSPLPLIAIALGVVMTAGSAMAMLGAGSGVGPSDAPPAKVFTSYVEEPSPTTATTLTVDPSPAPNTAHKAPPAERAREPLVKVGEIRIPRIGLVHPIYEGVSLTVVDHGPGHWPGSAMPGQLGNTVFAGHRVTHSHPFRRFDELAAGDEVIFLTADGEFRYQVTGIEIVGPRDTWIVNPTPDATMTLFACHPPGSAKQRIVIRGAYVGASSALS
ncbi:MAG: class E sortase [Acidimicrobiia bacterium]